MRQQAAAAAAGARVDLEDASSAAGSDDVGDGRDGEEEWEEQEGREKEGGAGGGGLVIGYDSRLPMLKLPPDLFRSSAPGAVAAMAMAAAAATASRRKRASSHLVTTSLPALSVSQPSFSLFPAQVAQELTTQKRERVELLAALATFKRESQASAAANDPSAGTAYGIDMGAVIKRAKELRAKADALFNERIRKEDELKRRQDAARDLEQASVSGRDASPTTTNTDPHDSAGMTPSTAGDHSKEEELTEVVRSYSEEVVMALTYKQMCERLRKERDKREKDVLELRLQAEECELQRSLLKTTQVEAQQAKHIADLDLANLKKSMAASSKDWSRRLQERRKELKSYERERHKMQDELERDMTAALERQRARKQSLAYARTMSIVTEIKTFLTDQTTSVMHEGYARLQHFAGGAGSPEEIIEAYHNLDLKAAAVKKAVAEAEARERNRRTEFDFLKQESDECKTLGYSKLSHRNYDGTVNALGAAKESETQAFHRYQEMLKLTVAVESGLHALLQSLTAALPGDTFIKMQAGRTPGRMPTVTTTNGNKTLNRIDSNNSSFVRRGDNDDTHGAASDMASPNSQAHGTLDSARSLHEHHANQRRSIIPDAITAAHSDEPLVGLLQACSDKIERLVSMLPASMLASPSAEALASFRALSTHTTFYALRNEVEHDDEEQGITAEGEDSVKDVVVGEALKSGNSAPLRYHHTASPEPMDRKQLKRQSEALVVSSARGRSPQCDPSKSSRSMRGARSLQPATLA